MAWKIGKTDVPGILVCQRQVWPTASNRVISQRWYGPLTRYVNLRVAHAPGMPGTFSRHRLQSKPLFSDPGMHHGTWVTHVPWCMSRSLTHSDGENVPGIPGACATRNFTYLASGPCNEKLNAFMVNNTLLAFKGLSVVKVSKCVSGSS